MEKLRRTGSRKRKRWIVATSSTVCTILNFVASGKTVKLTTRGICCAARTPICWCSTCHDYIPAELKPNLFPLCHFPTIPCLTSPSSLGEEGRGQLRWVIRWSFPIDYYWRLTSIFCFQDFSIDKFVIENFRSLLDVLSPLSSIDINFHVLLSVDKSSIFICIVNLYVSVYYRLACHHGRSPL